MQFASCASSSWRCPALFDRAMMLPVALHTAAQSRLRRMQATRLSTSRSDRHASAHAVQVSTQLKQASMQRLIVSEWGGLFRMGAEHGADGDGGHRCLSFAPGAKHPHPTMVPDVTVGEQDWSRGTPMPSVPASAVALWQVRVGNLANLERYWLGDERFAGQSPSQSRVPHCGRMQKCRRWSACVIGSGRGLSASARALDGDELLAVPLGAGVGHRHRAGDVIILDLAERGGLGELA